MTLFVNEEEEDEEERTGLAEALDSLLDAKPELDLTWAESVRQILESTNLSTPSPSTMSTSSPGYSPWPNKQWDQHPHHDKVVAGLEGELVVLKTALGVSNSHRRMTSNRMLDLKGNIRVFCRVRPFLPHEKNARLGPLTTPGTDLVKIPNPRKDYQFDRVFLPTSVQDDVFSEVEPIIRSALDGHNVCIFAYGQTGTGKTFTMEGSREHPGVVPRTLRMLFDEAFFDTSVSYNFSFSMLEVYKGSLRDLLVPKPRGHTDPASPCLSIQMGTNGYIDVENLSEMPILDAKEAAKLYQRGSRSRSTAWTHANESSSRSHCLLRITITCKCMHENREYVTTSKLWMVDLGGSERLLKTNAQGLTLEEGKAINLSLSALGDVISALQRKEPHIPYRNSKLTQLLRDSLGEDSKTLMLVHVSPKEDDVGETICSLNFASRARGTHLGRELSPTAKREKQAAMAELYRLTNIYEGECQNLRESIKTIEALMEERKATLPEHMQDNPEQPKYSTPPTTPVQTTPPQESSSTSPVNSVPRFMSPTASSRGKKRTEQFTTAKAQSPATKAQSPTERPGKSPHSQPRKVMNAKVVDWKQEGTSTKTAQQAPQPSPKGQLELVPWPTMIKEVISEVLPHQLKAGYVILEDPAGPEGKEETERVSDQFSSETLAKNGLVTVQIQRERVEKTISVSTTKGGTCRGRRKVTVECSMTVAKRFVF